MSIIVAHTGLQENQLKSQKKKQLCYWQNMKSWSLSPSSYIKRWTQWQRVYSLISILEHWEVLNARQLQSLSWYVSGLRWWLSLYWTLTLRPLCTIRWQIDMVNIVLHCTFGSKSRICQIVSWHNTAHLLPYVSPLFAVSRGERVLDMQQEPHFCSHRKVSPLHSVELREW